MGGPLDGVLVLDLTQQLVGPGGTMLLADMGADVIRVEPPPSSDSLVVDHVGRPRAALNFMRSKRNISMDLRQPQARAIVYEIARRADVCYQNYRAGVAKKLGMDYATIRAMNPSIVYCEVSAFGSAGPERGRVGFDIIAQAGGGTMMPKVKDHALPAPQPSPIADVTGMCLGALGVVAALYYRKATGQGQRVTTSLLDGVVMQNILRLISIEQEDRVWRDPLLEGVRALRQEGASYEAISDATATGIGGLPLPQESGGVGSAGDVYYRAYRTADDFIAIGCLNLRQQRRLNDALALGDPRFDAAIDLTSPEATERARAMKEKAEAAFRSRTTAEWLAELEAKEIACGRVVNVLELFDSPHHRENQMVVEYDDPWVGPVRGIGYPIKYEASPMEMQRPAGPPGYYTDEILRWLGKGDAEIASLREAAVVF